MGLCVGTLERFLQLQVIVVYIQGTLIFTVFFFTQKNNCFPGEGAFCNGIKIHVSQTDKVSHIFSFCAFVVLD